LIGNVEFVGSIEGEINATLKQLWDQTGDTDSAWGMIKAVTVGPFIAVGAALATVGSSVILLANRLIQTGNRCIDQATSSEMVIGGSNVLLGGGARKYRDVVVQRNDFDCPTNSPSPGEAASAWLAGQIDECKLRAYVRAANLKDDQFLEVIKGSRFKFSALELQALKMRDGIERGSLGSRLREIGVLDREIEDELETLSNQLPGPSDIVRFMVRDADDENGVVKEFNLDQGFTDKYQSQLKEWGRNQGLSEKVAKYHWRSHWTIPSPTQLYNIWHRLRKRQGVDSAKLEKDIRTALEQQDILPYWIDRLLEISYLPVTRTDSKRAFNQGSIDEGQLRLNFIENGYSDESADLLTEFAKVDRREHIRHIEAIKGYAEGKLGITDVHEYVESLGYQASVLPIVDEVAASEKTLQTKMRITQHIITNLRSFKLNLREATELAQTYGVDSPQFSERIKEEVDFRNSSNKHIAMGQLCNMLEQDVISADEYIKNARDAGWSAEDSRKYLQTCSNKIEVKKARKQLADQAKEERQAREDAANQRRIQREQEAERKSLAKQLADLEKVRQQVSIMKEGAAANYAAKAGIDAGQATQTVNDTYDALVTTVKLTPNEAGRLVGYVSSNWGKFTDDDYMTVARKLSDAVIEGRMILPADGGTPEQP
jgi:DNA-binding transcriptional MerR regulator